MPFSQITSRMDVVMLSTAWPVANALEMHGYGQGCWLSMNSLQR